jgi:hypothetical protein
VDGTTGAITVVYTGSTNFLPEDITVGPDNKIYVCDPTNGRIVRMNQNGTNVETVYNEPAGGPQGPRFNSAGTLFFNTKGSNPSGVWKIDGLAAVPFGGPFLPPVNVLSATQVGEGLAFTNSGDLLIVNRGLGKVQCLKGPLDSCPNEIIGLTDPIGVVVNSVDDIFVARGKSPYDIQRFPSNDISLPTTYVDFSSTNNQPNYIEFTSDDTLFVATADAAMQNGKVWKVTPPVSPGANVSPTLLATLPKRQGKFPPAMGVGVPATSVSITKKIDPPGGKKVWNFGPHSFEVTAGPCTATITARQRAPEEVRTMLANGGFTEGQGQPLSGEEGWVTTWSVVPGASGCQPESDGSYGIAIAAIVDAAFNISPGIVRCDVSPNGSWKNCTKKDGFGYYPQSNLLPGDPVTSTRTKSFSEYLFVNLRLAQVGTFCGFQSPVGSKSFNLGQNITFKFQLKDGPNCTGNFITDANAVISVAQIELSDGKPTFDRKDIKASGNSNGPPLFRYDRQNNQYLFNLDTSGWPPGKYSVTVISDKFFPQPNPPLEFRLQ